jgi:hypothetical protein
MKKSLSLTILCFLAVIIAVPHIVKSQDSRAVLKNFTREGKLEGTTLKFTLLNEKTIDVLFTAPGKYAIRAQASQATAFYVLGVSEKNFTLNNTFVVEQNGQTFNCSAVNIENFSGGNVAKGAMIKGILQLDKKLDLTHSFKIKNAAHSFDMNLSDAVKEM